MSRSFGAIIIGDEILSGKRQDKHFAKIIEMLGTRGLRLSWVEYVGDDRARLTAIFRRTMAAGDIVFSCGGIGNTPDDHTRQAVAAALGVGLELHPQGYEELKARFNGEEINDLRKLLVTFPAGVSIIPNPFNRIPGFMVNDHFFVPGFPQMAHPMIEWALDTFYRDLFRPVDGLVEKAILFDRADGLRERPARPDGTHRHRLPEPAPVLAAVDRQPRAPPPRTRRRRRTATSRPGDGRNLYRGGPARAGLDLAPLIAPWRRCNWRGRHILKGYRPRCGHKKTREFAGFQ